MENDARSVREPDGMRQRSSQYLIATGTILNIIGAVLNCIGIKEAFLIWIVSDSLCAIYFAGAYKNWWTVGKIGDGAMIGMYGVYILTAIIGWTRV